MSGQNDQPLWAHLPVTELILDESLIQIGSLVAAVVGATLFNTCPASAAEGCRLDKNSPTYEVPAQNALDLADEVTLEAWVKADTMDETGGRILDKSAPGTQLGYMLDTWPGNSLRFLNAKGMCRCDAKLPADKWSHVAGVYSASKKIMKLYVDGKEAGSLDGDNWPRMTLSTVPLCVGGDPSGGNRFQGRILRAAVYGRALSGGRDFPAGQRRGTEAARWRAGRMDLHREARSERSSRSRASSRCGSRRVVAVPA